MITEYYDEGIDYSKFERNKDGYPGEFLNLEDIKEGKRIFFLDGPDKNLKEWCEIVDIKWDWKRHRVLVIMWNEAYEKFTTMDRVDVYCYARTM